MNRPTLRSTFCIAALFTVAAASAQSMWEKRLGPGLLYRQEVDASVPLVINALRFSPGSPSLKLVACLAKDKVFDETPDKGREIVSSMAKHKSALAGINGDFFQVPYTGDPLGAMVMEDDLISNPIYPRTAFGWGDGNWTFAMPVWKGTVSIGDAAPVALDGLNEAVGIDKIDLQMPTVGQFTAKTPNVAIYLKSSSPKLTPGSTVEFEVVKVGTDVAGGKLGDQAVLVASGSKSSALSGVKAGDRLKVNAAVEGFDWSKIHNVISGGPRLVHDGKVDVAWDAEKFRDSFVNKRHPRSAVGITDAGELWFVTVDGRQKQADGATLQELGAIMRRLGCVEALNFDGGGSSDLSIPSGPLNRPSDGAERPVANSFLFLETLPAASRKSVHTLAMRYPARLDPNGKFNLSLVEDGVKVPNSEVLWMSAGDGWVDQGGTVRALDPGSVKVIGYARGTKVETVIPIGAGVAPTNQKPGAKPATTKKPKTSPTTTGDD